MLFYLPKKFQSILEVLLFPTTCVFNDIFIDISIPLLLWKNGADLWRPYLLHHSPKPTSNVTAKEIDEEVSTSVRSGNDLASEIQQLLIDIKDNDAHELQSWVNTHIGIAPPETVRNRRIKRFKNAFSQVFDNLSVSRIITGGGKKKVYFNKNNIDVDIASLSSGEKQIVFRGAFLLRNQQSTKGSVVLIDEPEISLHPTWQIKIYDYYRKLFTETDTTQTSQIFFATHSQYVLRSALENRASTLIVQGKQRLTKYVRSFTISIFCWATARLGKSIVPYCAIRCISSKLVWSGRAMEIIPFGYVFMALVGAK